MRTMKKSPTNTKTTHTLFYDPARRRLRQKARASSEPKGIEEQRPVGGQGADVDRIRARELSGPFETGSQPVRPLSA
jgi:hypothetical protein